MLLSADAIQTGNQTKYAYTTGCSMKYSWCKTTPKIRLPQYIIGSLLFSMAVPIGFVYTVVILSKILGTQNQVSVSSKQRFLILSPNMFYEHTKNFANHMVAITIYMNIYIYSF